MQRNQIDTQSNALQGLSFLVQYPASQLLRLLVDGNLYENKPLGIKKYAEREPGCVKAFFDAFGELVKHVNDHEISVEFIQTLHKLCATGVKNLTFETRPGEFRTKTATALFGITQNRVTKEGIKSLLKWIAYNNVEALFGKENPYSPIIPRMDMWGWRDKKNKLDALIANETALDEESERLMNYSIWGAACDPEKMLVYFAPGATYLSEKMKEITDSYNKKIKNADTDDKKLEVMVEHIESYERLHPFQDVNGRVFVNLLLNLMLMQNGFPPATFDEPNIFDAYGTQGVVGKVKEAIEKSRAIIANEDVSNAKIDAPLQEIANTFSGEVKKVYSEMQKNQGLQHPPIPPFLGNPVFSTDKTGVHTDKTGDHTDKTRNRTNKTPSQK